GLEEGDLGAAGGGGVAAGEAAAVAGHPGAKVERPRRAARVVLEREIRPGADRWLLEAGVLGLVRRPGADGDRRAAGEGAGAGVSGGDRLATGGLEGDAAREGVYAIVRRHEGVVAGQVRLAVGAGEVGGAPVAEGRLPEGVQRRQS